MITLEVARDADGVPIKVELKERGSTRLTALFSPNGNMEIDGSRRYFTEENINLLKLIYPHPPRIQFTIPQPLAVTNVQGGKVVFYDDMEDLLKWSHGALDNAFAYSGDKSLSVTLAGGAATSATRFFPMPPSKKLSAEIVFAVDDWANFAGIDSLNFQLRHDDGNFYRSANIQFDRTGPRFYVYGADPYVAGLPVLPAAVTGVHGAWHKLKMEVAFNTNSYVRFSFNNFEWSIPTLDLQVGASTGTINSQIIVRGHAGAGGANFWVDSALVTEA